MSTPDLTVDPASPGPTGATDAPMPGWTAAGYRHRWAVIGVVIVADVMDLLDATVANLAGPSIRHDLGGSSTTLQWVLAAYTLTFAVGLVTSARAGDLFGRRRLFLVGMVGFTVASLLCGLAPGAGLLIAARVGQGLFGAVMIPQGLAMVKQSFLPADLAKAFIPFGPVMGLAAVLGPILAGVLLDADLLGSGWRSIFLINLPVGVVASVVAFRTLPRPFPAADGRAHRLDPVGTVLLTAASAMLVYPLVQGHELGWPDWSFGLLGASVLTFGLFGAHERRSSHPVVEPSLVTHRGYVGGLVFLSVFFVAMNGFMLVLNLHLQVGLGFAPLRTGLAMTPWALGIAVGAGLAGGLLGPRYGRRTIHGGLLLLVPAMAAVAWTVGHDGTGLTGWDLAPATAVAGLGCGLVFAPLFDIVLADLGDHEVGTGSGVLSAVQQYGGAIGVAVLGTLFFELVPGHGSAGATEAVVWVSVAAFALSFAVAFLMPRRAREDAPAH